MAKRCWVGGAGRLAVVPRAPRQVASRTQHRSNWSRSTVLAPFGHMIRAFPACPPCAGDSTRREAGPYSAQFRRSLSQDINVIYVAVGLVRLGQLPRCTVSPSDHTHQRRFSGSALAVVLSVCVWPTLETSPSTLLHASFNSFTVQLVVLCVAALCKLLGLQHFSARVAPITHLPSLCSHCLRTAFS